MAVNMRRSTIITSIIPALLWMLQVGPTHALDSQKQLFDCEDALPSSGQYAEDVAEFKAAYSLHRDWTVLGKLGMAQSERNEVIEAISSFRLYLEEGANAISPTKQTQIRKILEELESRVCELKVVVAPEGASVRIDGKDAGLSPLASPVRVNPGKREVEVTLEGHEDARITICVCGESKHQQMKVNLNPRQVTTDAAGLAEGLMKHETLQQEKRSAQDRIGTRREVYSLNATPVNGLMLARALADAGKLREARKLAMQTSKFLASPAEPSEFGESRAEAEKLASELTERIPSIRINLHHRPPNTSIEVLIDGSEMLHVTPGKPLDVDPGRHAIVALAAERVVFRGTIDIKEKSVTAIDANDVKEPKTAISPVWLWIPAGVAFAAIGSGGIFVMDHINVDKILQNACPNGVAECPNPDPNSSTIDWATYLNDNTSKLYRDRWLIGMSSVALAGSLAGFAITYRAYQTRSGDAKNVAFLPNFSASSVGLFVQGAF